MLPLWVRAILRRDVLILRESPFGLLLTLASTVLGVLLFGLLGRFIGQGTGYVTFVLSGIAFLRVVDAVVQAPGQGMREERTRGSLEVLLDSPRNPWALVALSGVVPATRSFLEGTIALTIATVLFDTAIHPGLRGLLALPLAIVSLLLLGLATGVLLAAAGMQSRTATAASTFFGLAVAMTAGVYYPRAALPGWLQVVSVGSPFTAALNTLREALTGAHGLTRDLLLTWASTGVITAAGIWLMARAVRKARETGAFARG